MAIAAVDGTSLAGIDRDSASPDTAAQTPTAIDSYQQAPMLDELELPPVAERLPENPMVVEPIESIGRYGGTWRTGMVGGADSWPAAADRMRWVAPWTWPFDIRWSRFFNLVR